MRPNAAPHRRSPPPCCALLDVAAGMLLLPLLALSLALIGCGTHAGASAIRLGAGLVAIAAHGGAGLFASEPASAFAVTGLVLNSSVAADQAVIAVAASVRHVRPVAVVAVVGFIGVVERFPLLNRLPLLLFRFPLLLLLLLFLVMLFLVM